MGLVLWDLLYFLLLAYLWYLHFTSVVWRYMAWVAVTNIVVGI